MRQVQVHARVLDPTFRCQPAVDVLDRTASFARAACMLAVLSAFWGTVLYLALLTITR